MPNLKRFAYEITRTVTYVEILVTEGEDEHEAHDAALDRVRDTKTEGSTFKYLGQSDYAKKLDILV